MLSSRARHAIAAVVVTAWVFNLIAQAVLPHYTPADINCIFMAVVGGALLYPRSNGSSGGQQ